MKQVKVEWCKEFIKSVFAKIPFENGGIECNCFWDKAEKSGLWELGTYGTPMSTALSELTKVETVRDDEGNFLYNVFRLASQSTRPGGYEGRKDTPWQT